MRIDMTTPDSPLRIVVKSSSRERAQRIINTIATRHHQRQASHDPLGLGDMMRRYGEPLRPASWDNLTQAMQAASA